MEPDSKHYPVVGRSSEIDLVAYTTQVNGRMIVDYEKLRREEPELYERILLQEREIDEAEILMDES